MYQWGNDDMPNGIPRARYGVNSSPSLPTDAGGEGDLQNVQEYQRGGKLLKLKEDWYSFQVALKLLIPRDNIITRFHFDKKFWAIQGNCASLEMTYGYKQQVVTC